jgi:hypothetical protein
MNSTLQGPKGHYLIEMAKDEMYLEFDFRKGMLYAKVLNYKKFI